MILVVYDNTGRVLYQMSGGYEVPSGIPYLEVDIDPNQYYVTGVDVSKNPHDPILTTRASFYESMDSGELSADVVSEEETHVSDNGNNEVFAQILLNQAKILSMMLEGRDAADEITEAGENV